VADYDIEIQVDDTTEGGYKVEMRRTDTDEYTVLGSHLTYPKAEAAVVSAVRAIELLDPDASFSASKPI